MNEKKIHLTQQPRQNITTTTITIYISASSGRQAGGIKTFNTYFGKWKKRKNNKINGEAKQSGEPLIDPHFSYKSIFI